jgi:hypothetical protein
MSFKRRMCGVISAAAMTLGVWAQTAPLAACEEEGGTEGRDSGSPEVDAATVPRHGSDAANPPRVPSDGMSDVALPTPTRDANAELTHADSAADGANINDGVGSGTGGTAKTDAASPNQPICLLDGLECVSSNDCCNADCEAPPDAGTEAGMACGGCLSEGVTCGGGSAGCCDGLTCIGNVCGTGACIAEGADCGDVSTGSTCCNLDCMSTGNGGMKCGG